MYDVLLALVYVVVAVTVLLGLLLWAYEGLRK